MHTRDNRYTRTDWLYLSAMAALVIGNAVGTYLQQTWQRDERKFYGAQARTQIDILWNAANAMPNQLTTEKGK